MHEPNTRTTAAGWTFADLTRSRRRTRDPHAAPWAGDAASYRVFAETLEPFIARHHGASEQPRADRWTHTRPRIDEHLAEDPALLSTWVSVRRNLRGVPFSPLIDRRTRLEVEARIASALAEQRARFPGRYQSIESLDDDRRRALIEDNLGFNPEDRRLIAAGIHRDWPSGRGLWRGSEGRRALRVNAEDHLEVLTWEHGARLSTCFCAARELAAALEGSLGFHYDDRLGYLTACPTNVGTGLRVSVVARLPRLSSELERLDAHTRALGLERRGSTELVELSNRSRLGRSELALVEDFAEAITELLAIERSL
jgi:protein-arginine kinase